MTGDSSVRSGGVEEHGSHPYDASRLWMMMDAVREYVASATWHEANPMDVSFSGATRHNVCTRVLCAESDTLDALREWAADQLAAGATGVNLHRTWQIPNGRNAGKRDNTLIERIQPPALHKGNTNVQG